MTFQWSWSRLKNYRACPKRHWEVDIAKNWKEDEGPALVWGHEVHKALANRLAKKAPLPGSMTQYEDWARCIEDHKLKVLVENQMAMTKEFKPCGFFDSNVWFRAVVDVLMLPHPTWAITYDWKTGKVAPEMEQLMLSAQVIFANYPEVDTIDARYVWLATNTETTKRYERDKMVPYWNELWPSINVMSEAFRTTTYPPKPSGLCKAHCPVKSCPHHGKGSF